MNKEKESVNFPGVNMIFITIDLKIKAGDKSISRGRPSLGLSVTCQVLSCQACYVPKNSLTEEWDLEMNFIKESSQLEYSPWIRLFITRQLTLDYYWVYFKCFQYFRCLIFSFTRKAWG